MNCSCFKKPFRFLTQHLRDVDETYFQHFKHAIYFSVHSLYASIVIFIHCLLPFLFKSNGSKTIAHLYKVMPLRARMCKINKGAENHIAIIGLGAGGVMSFYNLAQNYDPNCGKKLIIEIFDKSAADGYGPAYNTKNINHLLNVSAARMSAVESDPTHLVSWLKSNGYPYGPKDFIPRQIYGIYLDNLMAEACKIADVKGIKYIFSFKEIHQITRKNNCFIIDDRPFKSCVLAIGAPLQTTPINFWYDDIKNYLDRQEVHILGAGLTGFDAVLSLVDAGFDGKIFVHSRTGILPQTHQLSDHPHHSPLQIEDADLQLSEICKKFVGICRKSNNWNADMDAFRPITVAFWQRMSLEKKRRFLRHCFRLWNTHRHRVPPQQMARLNQLIAANKLIFTTQKINADSYINCIGFGFNNLPQLAHQLVKAGLAQYDELKMGIVSHLIELQIIGSLNFGTLLETTAIGELRKQASQTAGKLL